MNRRLWIPAVACAAAGILGAVIIAGTIVPGNAESNEPRPDVTPTVTATANPFAADAPQDPSAAAPAAEVDRPATIRIPLLGVESTLEDLHVGSRGELTAPVDFDKAGWYTEGPAPGEIGPAIIAGHVDSATGPAIFHRLGELNAGDEIIVDTVSGESLTFAVTGRMQSAKATFPTADVYRNVPTPELRLITCAGYFDRSIGHYTDNLILFASLVQ